jgi:GT2 family glycosyltransferase/2-polyprenyl-3-methyl-5-hydroxy-6-metoxy-1,4-benzoquinol methylase
LDENLPSKRYERPLINPDDKNVSPTLATEIERTGFNKTVLEIGTSTGYVSKILKEHGNRVTGIEIDAEAGSIAQQYCDRMIICDVETLDFDKNLEPAFFDVIICGDILEHLKKPATFLKKLKKFLKPNGYLVVSLPNFCHGDVILNLLQGDFRYTPTGLLDETHLRFFGLKNIFSLFAGCGYQISDLHKTNLNLGETELRTEPTKIPRDLLKFIQSLPDSTVYQYVFTAQPTHHPVTPPAFGEADINGLFFNALHEYQQELQSPLQSKIYAQEKNLKDKTICIEELERVVAAENQQIAVMTGNIASLRNAIASLDEKLVKKDQRIQEISANAQALEQEGSIKDQQIQEISEKARALEQEGSIKDQQIQEISEKARALEQEGSIKDQRIQEISEKAQALEQEGSIKDQRIREQNTHIHFVEQKISSIESSIIWQCTTKFHLKVVEKLLPQNTRRRKYYELGLKSGRILVNGGPSSLIQEYKKRRAFLKSLKPSDDPYTCQINKSLAPDNCCVGQIPGYINNAKKTVARHKSDVDIIICIHNAYHDVKECLDSVIKYSSPPFSLILIDDGSEDPTKNYVESFAQIHNATLIRNNSARGYTFAANQGLKASSAYRAILLNSDTIVTYEWLDRITECAESDEKIGIVGPLSNTASWQSVPDIENHGDWAKNTPPPEISVQQMGRFIAKYSSRTYPRIPFINGFCLLIKRDLINDIGYFDEDNFGKGYGEENDYCIRAQKAGWEFAIADDVYIYHSQSRSYSDEMRRLLCERSDRLLHQKHGSDIILKGVTACKNNKVLMGIRARTRVLFNRNQILLKGRNQFEGKRLLVLLPVCDQGGGAYVIIQECRSMMDMGVDVRLFNLVSYKPFFERNFPELEIPVIYGTIEGLEKLSKNFDAVICTTNGSVSWLGQNSGKKVTAYYVQDFEPDFYPPGSDDYKRASESYSKIPDMIRFTKTQWTHDIIKEKTGIECRIIGPSADIDLFRPLSRCHGKGNNEPVHITAMIRPGTPRRNPVFTLELLREIKQKYQDKVFIQTFGCSLPELSSMKFNHDFSFSHSGVVGRTELVSIFNDADIFLDCSSFQAMGLTAFEAMACGAAVIAPKNGGCNEVIKNEINGLIVDTLSISCCMDALNHLISDEEFRNNLSEHAITDICEFFPEQAAYNILNVIFGETSS